VVLGLVSICLAYADTYKADVYLIEKFGDAYAQYMKKVPRMNFVVGIIQLAQRRSLESGE
jgi:protein-S-isoprenylcysteine O-methyltransferase Ste14